MFKNHAKSRGRAATGFDGFSLFFFLMIRRPPRSTPKPSSAASDVYKRQRQGSGVFCPKFLSCTKSLMTFHYYSDGHVAGSHLYSPSCHAPVGFKPATPGKRGRLPILPTKLHQAVTHPITNAAILRMTHVNIQTFRHLNSKFPA